MDTPKPGSDMSPRFDVHDSAFFNSLPVIENEDGRQAGDPNKAARAIMDVLDSEDPPLRLALGPDAVDAIRAKHEALSEELARWESLALSTTFEEEAAA